MSSFASMFEVFAIARSALTGKGKNVVSVFGKSPVPDTDDEGAPVESESEEFEWWQHYGFVSKPPPDGEFLGLRLGRFLVGLASRALATAGVYGMLKDGDVALYSVGKQVLRLNADGSTTFLKLTKAGQHLVISVSADDEIKILHPDGPYFEMSKATLTMLHPTAPITIHSGVSIQMIAPMLVNEVGVVKLHMGASRPMVAGQNTAPNVFL